MKHLPVTEWKKLLSDKAIFVLIYECRRGIKNLAIYGVTEEETVGIFDMYSNCDVNEHHANSLNCSFRTSFLVLYSDDLTFVLDEKESLKQLIGML